MDRKIKILTNEQLSKLTKQRLRALLNSVRRKMSVKEEDDCGIMIVRDSEHYNEYARYMFNIYEALHKLEAAKMLR